MAVTPVVHEAIDAQTLSERTAASEPSRLLDVRTPAEFESAHIPGSHNVPLDRLGAHVARLAGLGDAPLIIVCGTGNRAREAQRKLAAAGAGAALVLEGGIVAWEASGGEVKRGRQRWGLERQVRLVAGSLVLTGVVGSLVWEPALWLAGFVGAGLTFSALSNTCTMATVLSKMPYNRGATCDVAASVAGLTEARS